MWNPSLAVGATATWTAGCGVGLASGAGTLKRVWDGDESEGTGTLRDGRRAGHWVERFATGSAWEGPYVDGKQHGHWVYRHAGGDVFEGPYVDGKEHGRFVWRYADGSTKTETYIAGELQ